MPEKKKPIGWRGLIRVALVHVASTYEKGVQLDELTNEVSAYVKEVLLAKSPQEIRDRITDAAIHKAVHGAVGDKDLFYTNHKLTGRTYHVCEGA